ncbi:hypothetical protein PTTG_25377 [Puccinia triticina 1-1 BBBD Race 1]|uniref:Uncharacterized protein n=2 Tax=Puccinia triticina TaxID=208348 RepID=A0A180H359_PUCT1|nr:uncharacterized protein PtA15_8A700 [Puccinia triticina]OAV99430.1 hypothetical protein PTTG_25377 [Puccinia triticina 1-1 BBBD Race 1]WAQ87793.1 hypothetical protein PtA15_8A700 [Puccinia triticina]WAR57667.1 hypothetical protein PtB15_8B720 [Puccinia triticina]
MSSRSLLLIVPFLLALWVANASASNLADAKYICVGKQSKGYLNSQGQFVSAVDGSVSGKCQCYEGTPPRMACEAENQIKHSPLPAVGDVFCSTTDSCT